MAHYSPELLAALRHVYEQTDEPMGLIASAHGIGITTLQTLVAREGWAKRSQRQRGHPPPIAVLEKARAAEAQMRAALSAAAAAHPPEDPSGAALAAPSPAPAPSGDASQSAAPPPIIAMLEAELAHEIAALNANRVLAAGQPRKRGENESVARTLSTLTQAMQRIERMRHGKFNDPVPQEGFDEDDDATPLDIDQFRIDLARRIDAFVESRTDSEDDLPEGDAAGLDEAPPRLRRARAPASGRAGRRQ